MNWENDQGGNYYDDDQIVHHERGLLEHEHDSQDEAEKVRPHACHSLLRRLSEYKAMTYLHKDQSASP